MNRQGAEQASGIGSVRAVHRPNCKAVPTGGEEIAEVDFGGDPPGLAPFGALSDTDPVEEEFELIVRRSGKARGLDGTVIREQEGGSEEAAAGGGLLSGLRLWEPNPIETFQPADRVGCGPKHGWLGCRCGGQVQGNDLGRGETGFTNALGKGTALGLEDQEDALVGIERELHLDLIAAASERDGADLVTHRIPALGHAAGLETQPKGLGVTCTVLIGDKEDILSCLLPVEAVQPVVGIPLNDLECGLNAGVLDDRGLQLFRCGGGRQQIGAASLWIGIAGGESDGWGRTPHGFNQGGDLLTLPAGGGGECGQEVVGQDDAAVFEVGLGLFEGAVGDHLDGWDDEDSKPLFTQAEFLAFQGHVILKDLEWDPIAIQQRVLQAFADLLQWGAAADMQALTRGEEGDRRDVASTGQHEVQAARVICEDPIEGPTRLESVVEEIGWAIGVVRRARIERVGDEEVDAADVHVIGPPLHLRVGQILPARAEDLDHGEVIGRAIGV